LGRFGVVWGANLGSFGNLTHLGGGEGGIHREGREGAKKDAKKARTWVGARGIIGSSVLRAVLRRRTTRCATAAVFGGVGRVYFSIFGGFTDCRGGITVAQRGLVFVAL
jgi:hypothetical protein